MNSAPVPLSASENSFGLSEHELRAPVNTEFLARPPLPLYDATMVTHLAVVHEGNHDNEALLRLAALLERDGWNILASSAAYRLYERGHILVRCEVHTEFSSYTLFIPTHLAGQFACATDVLPAEWRSTVAGKLLVAIQIELRSALDGALEAKMAELASLSQQMVVSRIVDGNAWVFTDFQIDAGQSAFLLLDGGLTPRQAGRTVQRLWEIETYRVMALLGLPVAQTVARRLRTTEEELANLTDRIAGSVLAEDEYAVLADLTALAAEVEHSMASTAFRFGAARAYAAIVFQRIDELRESRVAGFPTVREIMDRRFMPPMNTCAAMARRQDDLSGRVARISQLLRTRIDLAMKRQNQLVLTQMNQRARQQFRLQETVEGLSVVAITYYGSQLVHHLALGASQFWTQISPELATAVAVPVIAVAAIVGIRRLRRRINAEALVAAEIQST